MGKQLRKAIREILLRAVLALMVLHPAIGNAQGTASGQKLNFLTIERPPFAMVGSNGEIAGFSIELMKAIAQEMGRPVGFEMLDSFPDMLKAVSEGRADGAIANISITADREEILDFSQPIFNSGIQIMVPLSGGGSKDLMGVLLRWDLALLLGIAFLLLAASGMMMWWFERGKQDYFDRPAREALFPSFWWALNLVVNGGFEERIPHSRAGRVFAVILVVSSLFLVSIFVAQITSSLTVQAISQNISGLNDLAGKRVGTTRGSTASSFLTSREIAHVELDDLETLLSTFESGDLDAVAFDGPILAYYVKTRGQGLAELLPQTFKRENYGIALPTGSPIMEEINRALLKLRESGTYDEIRQRWFGTL